MTLPAAAFPLSVSGARLAGADGKTYSLGLGVNWGGAQQDELLPYGLDRLHRSEIIDRIAGWGMSHVRLPFAVATLVRNDGTLKTGLAKQSRLSANPDLVGLTPWGVLQVLATDLTAAGLYVVLNQHLLAAGWCCSTTDGNGFWYGDGWPPTAFIRAWMAIAGRFAGNPRVGYDLHNEPRPATIGGKTVTPTWGDGNSWTDFRHMYSDMAGRIRAVDPDCLIFCEGLSYASDLGKAGMQPVMGNSALTEPGRNIVYSAHDYSWFHPAGQSQADYVTQMDARCGYLTQDGIAPLWIGECLTLNAAILTRRGWLGHDEVRPGDETIGYNPATGHSEWTRIQRVVRYNDAEVWRIGGSRWHANVTPGHRWWSDYRASTGRRGYRYARSGFVRTDELVGADRLRLAARADTDGIPGLSTEDCAVLAWIQGDGHIQRRGKTEVSARIYQSKPAQITRLRALLAHIEHTEVTVTRNERREHHQPEHVFLLQAGYVRDLLKRSGLDEDGPEQMMLRMSPDQRSAWLSAMIDAEGHAKGGYLMLTQNEGALADTIQLAIYLEGHRPNKRRHQLVNGVLSWTIGLGRSHVAVHRFGPHEALERQPVWCVTTGLGTWTAKQDDQVFLTGNCGANTDVATAAMRSGWLPGFISWAATRATAGCCWWELSATAVLGTQPAVNNIETQPGQREAFGLLSGQDWKGAQADVLALLAPLM